MFTQWCLAILRRVTRIGAMGVTIKLYLSPLLLPRCIIPPLLFAAGAQPTPACVSAATSALVIVSSEDVSVAWLLGTLMPL